MKRWECLEQARVPNGERTLSLMRHDDELEIRLDGVALMSTRSHGGEDALAELACDRMGPRRAPRVAIGGLGLGFTLAAALRRLGPDARITVAELVPEVVRWCRGDAGAAAGHPLADPRVTVHDGDVAELIRRPGAPWDAILLDVDNGPTAMTRASNRGLYNEGGVAAAHRALRANGVLAIWSAEPDRRFTERLARAPFEVVTVPVRSRSGGRGERHLIWICTPVRGGRPA